MVSVLLTKGADPELADNKGWTPMLLASFHGFSDVVRCSISSHPPVQLLTKYIQVCLLLKKGVSTEGARPQDGFTALHLALAV